VIGANTHETFLKSYASHRAVQTLQISGICFESLSYFCRFILCFPILRNLDLQKITISKLKNHPPNLARRKQLKLDSFRCNVVYENEFSHFVPWLVNADAFTRLESLSLHLWKRANQKVHVGIIISNIISSAGAWLKNLELRSTALDYVDCRSNSTLEAISLYNLRVLDVVSILSTVSSQVVSVLNLERLQMDNIEDVESLAKYLLTSRFCLLDSHVAISRLVISFHLRGWRSLCLSRTERIRWKNLVEEGTEQRMSKLRNHFDERMVVNLMWPPWLQTMMVR